MIVGFDILLVSDVDFLFQNLLFLNKLEGKISLSDLLLKQAYEMDMHV